MTPKANLIQELSHSLARNEGVENDPSEIAVTLCNNIIEKVRTNAFPPTQEAFLKSDLLKEVPEGMRDINSYFMRNFIQRNHPIREVLEKVRIYYAGIS